ncbi:hypothetical protein A3C26_02070 [Candidatus Daviesbacteria bacterium RIFCSPHIGHO2_02_FULL_39_12]|uniref:Uncharacterized protein n=1 Tax=Candidatus Daviesbacteria bacterium RIFCSPHIGHO2_02_FULL_39_12 TaxID=1797770 RepID=A0A1F5J936_9BACT|nr:MAG: hypothetical protein A3C26_02070 [Candidatus Daviesbacteria bacterium RIFCSPHIGHO2_02_FULL_39_12]
MVSIPELYLVKEAPRIRALRASEEKTESGKVVRTIEKMSKSKPETVINLPISTLYIHLLLICTASSCRRNQEVV